MSLLDNFKTAKGEKISSKRLFQEIKDFILKDSRYQYKILIGTDSEVFNSQVEFISVIVVHRVGNGARYFWRKEIHYKISSLKERLWDEAILSLNLGQEIFRKITNNDFPEVSLEIHLDLGYGGQSSSSIKEIINLIKGHGFDVKIKPESYAASKIADRLI